VTAADEDLREQLHPRRQQLSLLLAVAATVPGVILRLSDAHLSDPADAFLYGMAIVGSAFMLSWAAETAQLDVSAGLAIAVLAFIAVLPEYAVDLVFAIKGGQAFQEFGPACQSAADAAAGRASSCALALANMTGANRLLIGLGWSMVVFVAWWRYRARGERMTQITLARSHAIELAFLSAATVYSLTLPMKSKIYLWDAAILVAIFAAYTVRLARAPAEEPHLVGPASWIGTFSTAARRGSVVGLFALAAVVILLSAEHFADALVATGSTLGIGEFFLVQWLAPLASEAPELLVAGLYAWRLKTNAGLGTLVSSKVNQWTLLVGTLPIFFAFASGSTEGLPIIARQREEVFLTAAQSFFAVAILVNLSMSVTEAWALFVLFWAQFVAGAVIKPEWHSIELVAFAVAYLVLGAYALARNRRAVPGLLRDGFVVPHSELSRE
jgi:cation:H+ antiporter